VLSDFIAAVDAGRPLSLADVTDELSNYNEQWRHCRSSMQTRSCARSL